MFRLFCVFFVFFAGCWLCVCNLFRMLWQSVCNVVAICSPRICNPFRMYSRNVRNVFVICVLHIRHVKVWFLRCKSMVFGVQKGGFYIAKVWFLFFECCVVAICQQHFGKPSAAVGVDLSRPHICVRHAFCVCLVDIKSVQWQLCPLAKMVRLRWLCSVCLPVCRLFGYC